MKKQIFLQFWVEFPFQLNFSKKKSSSLFFNKENNAFIQNDVNKIIVKKAWQIICN